MLATVTVWLMAGISAWGYGTLFTRAGLKDHESSFQLLEYVALRLYAGLLILAAVFMLIALHTNISWSLGLVVSFPGFIIGLLRFPSSRCRAASRSSFFWTLLFSAGSLLILALFVSSTEVQYYDTGLYHQQVVKWLSQYGFVPGLALVHFRFGWTSSWFAGAAALNHGFLAGREAGIMGGTLLTLMVISTLAILWRARNLKIFPDLASLTWICFCGMSVVVTIVWHLESSLSPDLVIWLLPIMVALLLNDSLAHESDRIGRTLLLAALACTVKFSSAPLLGYSGLLWSWRFVRAPESRKKLLLYLSFSAAILLLLAATNKRVSGCPLYPSPIACSSGESSVGAGFAATVTKSVREFAEQGDRHIGLYVFVAFLTTLCSLKMRQNEFVRHCLIGSWSGILFVLVTAPNPRFGLGYFLLPVAVSLAILMQWIDSNKPTWIEVSYKLLPVFILVLGTVSIGFSVRDMHSLRLLLLPLPMPRLVGDPIHIVNRRVDTHTSLALTQEQLGEIVLLHPESSAQCWDAPLPCTPYRGGKLLELKDPKKRLSAGFRLSTPYQSMPVDSEDVPHPLVQVNPHP